jgi:hypothetical protein
MNTFERYLTSHNLQALTVALFSRVRYLTVWNAMKGNPILPEQAAKIKESVLQLTGVPYTGTFTLLPEQSPEGLPTVPVKQVKIFPD